jgi:hypothetical protein
MIGRAIDTARSRAVGDAANARFLQGDVARLDDLDIGEGYTLINDSGCYYGLDANQRDAYAEGVTRIAAPEALLLMAGCTKIPGIVAGTPSRICAAASPHGNFRPAPWSRSRKSCATPASRSR